MLKEVQSEIHRILETTCRQNLLNERLNDVKEYENNLHVFMLAVGMMNWIAYDNLKDSQKKQMKGLLEQATNLYNLRISDDPESRICATQDYAKILKVAYQQCLVNDQDVLSQGFYFMHTPNGIEVLKSPTPQDFLVQMQDCGEVFLLQLFLHGMPQPQIIELIETSMKYPEKRDRIKILVKAFFKRNLILEFGHEDALHSSFSASIAHTAEFTAHDFISLEQFGWHFVIKRFNSDISAKDQFRLKYHRNKSSWSYHDYGGFDVDSELGQQMLVLRPREQWHFFDLSQR